MDLFSNLISRVEAILHWAYIFLGIAGWTTVLDEVVVVVAMFGATSVFVMFLVWMERKVSARMQSRIGPNRVGPLGLLQTLADAIKLTVKEDVKPVNRDKIPYSLAPIVAFVATFMGLVVIPFDKGVVVQDLNVGILYIVAITSFTVIAILTAGWSSNNRFALLGGFRSAAQIVSYEVPLVSSLVPIIMTTGTLSLNSIVLFQKNLGLWFVVPQILGFLIFLTSATAEANRAPFDIPEAESGAHWRFPYRILGSEIRHVFPGRVHRHRGVLRRGRFGLLGRLASFALLFRLAGPGICLVHVEADLHDFPDHVLPLDLSPPARGPAHGFRLEGADPRGAYQHSHHGRGPVDDPEGGLIS